MFASVIFRARRPGERLRTGHGGFWSSPGLSSASRSASPSAAAPVYISEGRSAREAWSSSSPSSSSRVTIGIVPRLPGRPGVQRRRRMALDARPRSGPRRWRSGFGMMEMPQSPRWLVMAGKDYIARATLARIRTGGEEAITQELEEIKESLDVEPGGWARPAAPGGEGGALRRGRGWRSCSRSPASTQSSTTRRRSSSTPASTRRHRRSSPPSGSAVVNVGHDRGRAAAPRSRRTPHALDDRRFPAWSSRSSRSGAAFIGGGGKHRRLDRGHPVPDDLRGIVRDQPRPDLLVDERRDLSPQRAQQGGRGRHHGQLDPSTPSSR